MIKQVKRILLFHNRSENTVTECNVLVKKLCNELADTSINLSTHVSCKDSHSYWLIFLFFLWFEYSILVLILKCRGDFYFIWGFNFSRPRKTRNQRPANSNWDGKEKMFELAGSSSYRNLRSGIFFLGIAGNCTAIHRR